MKGLCRMFRLSSQWLFVQCQRWQYRMCYSLQQPIRRVLSSRIISSCRTGYSALQVSVCSVHQVVTESFINIRHQETKSCNRLAICGLSSLAAVVWFKKADVSDGGSLLTGGSGITPDAGDRHGVINTNTRSSPNWVSEDDTMFGYESESVAQLCSAALV